jgi:para-aminobenzoate synthetase
VADAEELFRRYAEQPRMFWLDGGGGRSWSGRRSVLGVLAPGDVSLTYDAARRQVLRHRAGRVEEVGDDIFTVLADQMAAEAGDPSVSWVGYLGYACRPDLPAVPAVPAAPADPVPDAVWMRLRDPVVVEHPPTSPAPRSEPSMPPERALNASGASPQRLRSEPSTVPEEYQAAFEEVQRELRAGNSYEVNLTYRDRLTATRTPAETYLRLRRSNPAPYAGFLRHGPVRLLSSSPERFAVVDRHRWVETRPIKGTTARGRDAAEDAANRAALATGAKYRAENLMIVDLLRNDLSMVCEPGTVTVPELMTVESYPSVHQLVSTVRGRLREGIDTVAALRALFPAGSMTGAPKHRTMQIIDRVEAGPRGVYAGAFGWLSADGRADLGVVIRSLVAVPDPAGWRYELGTGGGITVRSEVAEEYAESAWKAERLRAAVLG